VVEIQEGVNDNEYSSISEEEPPAHNSESDLDEEDDRNYSD
jgi:hypothetical protein